MITSVPKEVQVFGVRHLSPGVAWHLLQFLSARKPKWVLLEGPSDLDSFIPFITDRRTIPPFAALAFTRQPPASTVLFPLAAYSPEYQALLWAKKSKAVARHIDIPTTVILGQQVKWREDLLRAMEIEATSPETADDSVPSDVLPPAAPTVPASIAQEDFTYSDSIEEQVRLRAGALDYPSYWEGVFECPQPPEIYREALLELGLTFRTAEGPQPRNDENLIREAYMRRCILDVINNEGAKPSEIVVIVGAFHASAIHDLPPMTDAELEALPKAEAVLTLMPYSYRRLATQSGYGAGNHAPAYFQLLWEALSRGSFRELSSIYCSSVARFLREKGTFRSTAEVIEAERLALGLAEFRDRAFPVLSELQDAVATILGQGSATAVSLAVTSVNIGNEVGRVPDECGTTSIQQDFSRELKRLRLEKYRQQEGQLLELDLRENRRASSSEAAFLDLYRSSFLNRLVILSIPFGKPIKSDQDAGTWSEDWELSWSSESEIRLVESVLLGETIQAACTHELAERMASTTSVERAAILIRAAANADLPSSMADARLLLRNLAALSVEFTALARAAQELAGLVRYGDVRGFDPEPIQLLVGELFRGASLHLASSSHCDSKLANEIALSMSALNRLALENSTTVDGTLWQRELSVLSTSDTVNPLLAGYATALLLDRGLIDDAALALELSRRLSPGTPVDVGAAWFEGLSRYNRFALISRLSLWKHLEDYIASLDPDRFKAALVFLRRAFQSFTAPERMRIAENLGELWGVGVGTTAQALGAPLTEEETKDLSSLNEYDFGDL